MRTESSTLRSPGHGGSVLILAVWSLFFLAALAVAIGGHVSAGLQLARAVRVRVEASALAQAGVAQAMVAIMEGSTNAWDGGAEDAWNRSPQHFKGSLPGGVFQVEYVRMTDTGGGETNLGVIGEESRVNVNRAPEPLLASLFFRVGVPGDPVALAAAIMARRVPPADSTPLTDRTRSAYDPGGSMWCESVSDLMDVPGIDAAVLARIDPWVTVHGSGKINLNTTGPVVLASLADRVGAGTRQSRDSLVRKVDAFRQAGRSFKVLEANAIADALAEFTIVSPEERAVLMAMMGELTIRSEVFRGVVRAWRNGQVMPQAGIEWVYDARRNRMVAWEAW